MKKDHKKNSGRVVKMDHGDIGSKCELDWFCCIDQLQNLVWICTYFIHQMANFLTSWPPIIFWTDVCVSCLKSPMGDKRGSTMNLNFQIFTHDFSTVGLESAFYNYTNGFPKYDFIYWGISLRKRVALFALLLLRITETNLRTW